MSRDKILKKIVFLFLLIFSLQLSAQITRQPYLQIPCPTGITVRWNTSDSIIGVVHYGLNLESLLNSVTESEARIFHELELTGLEPDTKYYYSINTEPTTEEQYFITSPVVGNKGKTRIWVISDFGQSSIDDNPARELTVKNWKEFNNDNLHADLILSLGDQTENDTQEELTLTYFDQLEDVLLNTPLFTIEGNHDNHDDMVNYLATFSLPTDGKAGGFPSNTEDYYSFDYGNIHIIGLSTEINDIDGNQLTWLRNDLKNIDKEKTDWLIACLHRPFHSGGYHLTDLREKAQIQRDYWLTELEDYGVDLILQGHNAIYERSFLIDNLILKTTDLKLENIINIGDGREDGDGAYYKEPGLNPHQGTIFIEVAPGGNSVNNNANYSIFSCTYSGSDIEGSVVIDVDGENRMDVSFLCNKADTEIPNPWDTFTIIKTDTIETADQIHFSIISNNAVTFDWIGTSNIIYYGTDYTNLCCSDTAVNPDFLPVTSPWVSDPGPYWEAKLTGLLEDTEYFYKIGRNGQLNKFRTPPPRGTADFRICSTSDMQSSSSESVSMFNQIAELNPDIVITTGDLTGGDSGGQQYVKDRFKTAMVWSQSAAWMPSWGNHDWENPSGDDLRNYKGRFDIPNPQTSPSSPDISCCGEDWGWFDYGNARFISIPERWNSETTWQDWSVEALPIFQEAQNDPDIKFIVSYGHQSAYTSAEGRYGGSGTLKTILNGLNSSYSKYKLDLSGHNHQYERYSFPGGLTYIINSTLGSYYRGWDDPVKPDICSFRAAHYGILVLDFSETAIQGQFFCSVGTSNTSTYYKPLEENVCDAPGSVIDAFTIYDSIGVGIEVNQISIKPVINNYPNPFNLSTNISYSLEQTGKVKIEIYDLFGRIISTLVDVVQEQGEHTIEWLAKDKNGNNLPGGIYFAQISTGEISKTTKMMLLN